MTSRYRIESAPGAEAVVNGRRCLYFGGVGYFGLHGNAELMAVGVAAWRELGIGFGTQDASQGRMEESDER